MNKELKACTNPEDLECNENVKHKTKEYIKKYMQRFGSVYKPKEDTEVYWPLGATEAPLSQGWHRRSTDLPFRSLLHFWTGQPEPWHSFLHIFITKNALLPGEKKALRAPPSAEGP